MWKIPCTHGTSTGSHWTEFRKIYFCKCGKYHAHMEPALAAIELSLERRGGGRTPIWFWRRCAAQASNPLISKHYFGSKRYHFGEFFLKYRCIFQSFQVLHAKYPTILKNSRKWTNVLGFFYRKMQSIFRDFLWKSNPFKQHIPLICSCVQHKAHDRP